MLKNVKIIKIITDLLDKSIKVVYFCYYKCIDVYSTVTKVRKEMTIHNNDNSGFYRAFDELKRNQSVELRDLIVTVMGWQQQTFYAKKSGRRRLSNAEVIVLREIFRNHGIKF
jgi:hypothetical protein